MHHHLNKLYRTQSAAAHPKPHHPLLIRKYSCRFLPYHSDVYSICRYKSGELPHYKNLEYFTAPFFQQQPTQRNIEQHPPHFNVLVTFACPHHAQHVIHQMQQSSVAPPKKEDMLLSKMSLKEASYHANIIRVPLVTVLNAYCDSLQQDKSEETHDIFYTTRFLQTDDLNTW